MSTLRKQKLEHLLKLRSMRLALRTKKTTRRWKAALIGLLLICVSLTSGCLSKPNLPVEPSQVTVDASLMVESNYRTQMLKLLSD